MCNADASACFDTALDVTWVGIGDLMKINVGDKTISGGFKFVFHVNGDVRLAIASSNFFDADGTTNLTPNASTVTALIQSDNRTVTITFGRNP